MGIIAWIVLGLLAGILAKFLLPGDDPGGIIITTIIGIVGAILGGLVAKALGFGDPIDEFFDISTWVAAIIGSIVLLVAYRAIAGRGGALSRTTSRSVGRVPRYRYVVLAVGFFAQAAFTAASFSFAVLSPALADRFEVGLGALAVAIATTSGGMTLTLLGWGLLSDRVGERAVLSTGLAGAALLLGLAATASTFWLLVALVTLAGMAGAASNAATGRAVMSWFPASERGLALGIRQTSVPVGGGIGAIALPALESSFGIGAPFAALAVGCALASTASLLWLREAPGFPDEEIAPHVTSPLRDRRLWLLAGGSTMLVSVQIALTGFVVLYLHEERGLTPGKAAAVLAVINVAGAVLRIGLGTLSDRIGSRLRPLRRLSLGLAAATAAAAALTEASDPLLIASLITAGALAVGWNGLSFTATAELAGRERSGAALGFQQTALGLGCIVAPLAFAGLVQATSWPVGFGFLAVLPLGAFVTFGPLLAAERRG